MATPSCRAALLALASSALVACREGTEQTGDFVPVFPSPSGTQGCGPAVDAPTGATPVFNDPSIGPLSQIAAVAGAETLYLTGGDGSIHQLDFPVLGNPPTDTVLVAPGVIEASYLAPRGIGAAAVLSGIAVLDAQFLVVAEHSSNSLVAVDRLAADTVSGLAGLPLATGGYSDGAGGNIRFHFTEPVPLFADAFGVVYVGDTENHALRQVSVAGLPLADTIVGNGAPGSDVGSLVATQLDTPSGLASTCPGELLLLESGQAGVGGHRLLSLAIGEFNFLIGGLDGSSMTLAGDGTDATTQGVDTAAQLGSPRGLASTQDGFVFWVDATTGNLRRYDFATGLSDCPLFSDCAAAVLAGGSFTPGGHFSVALGDSGTLYVLDADSGTLFRIDP
jgi:hypothetical protein